MLKLRWVLTCDEPGCDNECGWDPEVYSKREITQDMKTLGWMSISNNPKILGRIVCPDCAEVHYG